MFNKSKNGIITISQGETCQFELETNIGTEILPKYPIISDSDQFYFSIMEPNQAFEKGLIRQVLTKESSYNEQAKTVTINLTTRDTECLKPGIYYYGLKLNYGITPGSEPRIITLISNTKFYII